MSEGMATAPVTPPPILREEIVPPEKALRRLFLTLFLRGRGARGLNKQSAPTSVGQKLGLTLLVYGLLGMVSLAFLNQPVFALAVYLHGMTFLFLGMFVAASAGEILFNKEEADILMHRPISPQTMLWAKIRVLVEVSLWLAGAFNLVGLLVGLSAAGGWRFFLAHVCSLVLEAIFCTGCVVLTYQLCLRCFGRERLESLMTMAQVMISIAAVMGGQILPRVMGRLGNVLKLSEASWWIALVPPAWFAGLDDVAAGEASLMAWLMAGLALAGTGTVVWLAFGRLAQDYEVGLQSLNENVSRPRRASGRQRWLDGLVGAPPMSWWLRDPVERAAFVLTVAYLLRDRETKLRVYPGVAPIVILPFFAVWQGNRDSGLTDFVRSFFLPFVGIYLGMIPAYGLQLIRYSQQWQATDVFHLAPIPGPARICHGARRAVMFVLAFPLLLLVLIIEYVLGGHISSFIALLPGMTLLPVFSIVESFIGKGLPLCEPIDSAKAARRGLVFYLITLISFALSAVTAFALNYGWFWPFEGTVLAASAAIYWLMYWAVEKRRWASAE